MISINQNVIYIGNIKCPINKSIFSIKKINFNHKVTFNTFNFYLIISKITLEVLYFYFIFFRLSLLSLIKAHIHHISGFFFIFNKNIFLKIKLCFFNKKMRNMMYMCFYKR